MAARQYHYTRYIPDVILVHAGRDHSQTFHPVSGGRWVDLGRDQSPQNHHTRNVSSQLSFSIPLDLVTGHAAWDHHTRNGSSQLSFTIHPRCGTGNAGRDHPHPQWNLTALIHDAPSMWSWSCRQGSPASLPSSFRWPVS